MSPSIEVAHAWAVMGLTISDPEALTLSQADIDGLATWVAIKTLVGDDAALTFLRVLGNTMARLAEAGGTMARIAQPDLLMGHSGDELTTAKAYRAMAEITHRFGGLIDAVFRQHIVSARTHFEGVITDASASVTCGIGFADLTGFTALTQVLTPTELSDLLLEFGGSVSDLVHADGGRVVKFIGDEVMWVTSTPELLAKVASTSSSIRGRGRPACRCALASAMALCWGSAATTSASRSIWRPAWWRPRRLGRSWRPPMSATSCPTGQRFPWIR